MFTIFSYSVVSDSENCVVRNIMLIEKIIKRYRIKSKMRNSRDFVDSRVIETIEDLDLPHTKQKYQSFPVVADLDLTVIIQSNIVMTRNQRIVHV